jgi:sugar lactone lactonase YvrE
MAVDTRGNIYAADTGNNRVRRVDKNGFIWTFAGPKIAGNQQQPPPTGGFSEDGTPVSLALLDRPTDVAVDVHGNVYIADSGNGRIRMVTPEGFLSTIAGSGGGISSPVGDGGPATNAALVTPYNIAVDLKGNIYIADFDVHRIRRVSPDLVITTFAGTGEVGFSGDGGPATQATLHYPRGIAVDGEGNVYIADSGNNRIRRVDRNGTITTFAGTGVRGFAGDGGPATQAALDTPTDVAVDARGYVYIAFLGSYHIRRVSPLRPLEVPSISLSASSLTFDATQVGSASETTFTISNAGKAPLSVIRIGLERPDAQFRVSPTSGTVEPGGTLTVKVILTPISFGPKTATLSIVHNALGSPSFIDLSARGPTRSRDFNGDGRVNLEDFFLFAFAFGQPMMADTVKFDIDGDGRINFADFFLFAESFGR